MKAVEFDEKKAEAFAEKVGMMLNSAATTLLISLGHRTRLFDVMAELPPATSEKIAEAAGLHERYVREWLAGVVTGGIVEYDDQAKTYRLPDEHACWLTRAASPNNLAVMAQFVPQSGQVEDELVQCFIHGGGVPYSSYNRFHEIMAEDSGQTVVSVLDDKILPIVPGLKDALKMGIDVLDIGCGSGRALNLMASLYPNSRFTGYDLSETALATAQAEAELKNLTNVKFVVKDCTHMNDEASFDFITAFDAIHDQAFPDQVLASIHKALRPNGTFLMQDIHASSDLKNNLEHPFAPLLYTISCMHCTTVSLAQGGVGLGTMWGKEKALEFLNAAGFQQIETHELEHDPFNLFFVAKK